MSDYVWVDEESQLAKVVRALEDAPRFAVDTEFHREGCYWPQLALIQVATIEQVWLIDTVALDPAPLNGPLSSGATVVMHAPDQDLIALYATSGAVPTNVFDTQLAARLLGVPTPSLDTLVGRFTEHRLPRSNQMANWLERPLGKAQQRYAAADVAHLLELADTLGSALAERGRLGWLDAEMAATRGAQGHFEPAEAWRRVKDLRKLNDDARVRAMAVAAWRETEAQRRDSPVRHVLSDIAVTSIAQRDPGDARALEKVRGLRGSLGKRQSEGILAALRGAGEFRPAAETFAAEARSRARVPPELRPMVALTTAWIDELARRTHVDVTLLATRAEVEALLVGLHTTGAPTGPLSEGWRAEVLGDSVRRLAAGETALRFAEGAGLVEVQFLPNGPAGGRLAQPHHDGSSASVEHS